MSGFLSDYSASRVCDTVTKRGVASSYLALITSTPTHATSLSAVTELAISGYVRQSVAWSVPAFDSGSGAWLSSNLVAVSFGPFPVDMTSVSAWAILVDEASGTTANILYAWALNSSIEAAAGSPIQFAAGQLIIYSA
jgi:hypothetical protein